MKILFKLWLFAFLAILHITAKAAEDGVAAENKGRNRIQAAKSSTKSTSSQHNSVKDASSAKRREKASSDRVYTASVKSSVLGSQPLGNDRRAKQSPSKGFTSSGTTTSVPARTPEMDEEELEVISLTSRSFSGNISDGSVWMIEFYSPSCIHCQEFAQVYSDIARHYHSTNDSRKRKIKIAKVNGQNERALVSRFGIYAYPTFFVVDGWSVYEFQQPRIKKEMMNWVEGGYLATEPVPFYASPMGPVGQAQGFVISSGHVLSDVFDWSNKTLGFSYLITGMLLFGSLFIGCFLLIVFLALAIPAKHKLD